MTKICKTISFRHPYEYELHDIYRALSVLAQENDFIQAELYKNSQDVAERRKDILFYDCTNYYFELEEEDGFRRYGKSKQYQPLLSPHGAFMVSPWLLTSFPETRVNSPF